MKNWLKILAFTLKQAIKGPKFVPTTVIIGIVILVAAGASNIFLSGAFDKELTEKDLKAAYIVNETKLSIDSDSFINEHRDEYPYLKISEISDMDAKDAAKDPAVLGQDAAYSVVLQIAEDEDSCNLTVYIPNESSISGGDGEDFAKEFAKTVKNSKIKSTGVSADKINMAISSININEVKAEEADDIDESLLASMANLFVIMFLYFMVLFYGQSIGQIVSMEKTSKLMEYMLTLTSPMGIIFGKVTAIFCEAVIQLVVWIACGAGGFILTNIFITGFMGEESKNVIALFLEKLPEGGVSGNFVVLLILTVIAILAAFFFYCFVAALFASFAATAEDLAQTNSLTLFTMMLGFLVSMYVPDNSKLGTTIIRILPITSPFVLPSDVIAGRIGLLEYVIYLAILLAFTVLMAILTGKVYKDRLFKNGTKKIFKEILGVITGKTDVSNDSESSEITGTESANFNFENYDNAKKAYTIIGFSLLALILSGNALGGLVGSVVANIMAVNKHMALADVYEDVSFLVIGNIISMYMIAVPVCALVSRLSDDSVLKTKGTISKNLYLRLVFIMFPVAYGLSLFSNFLASKLSGGEAENQLINSFLNGNVLAIIMVAVLAPVFEELVFRKLIIDRTRRFGELTAIIYSSLAFGLFHCNIYQIFYAFAIGLILGYIYVKTGNVILTIILHMIMNGSSSILYPLAPQLYNYFQYCMVALGIGSIIYTLIKRDIRLEHKDDEIPAKQLSAIAYTNSGTILFTLVCFIIMLYQLFAPILLKQG